MTVLPAPETTAPETTAPETTSPETTESETTEPETETEVEILSGTDHLDPEPGVQNDCQSVLAAAPFVLILLVTVAFYKKEDGHA